MSKPIPELQTDADAERFVERSDLSRHDLSSFVHTRFEFEPKAAQLNMRLPETLLQAVKAQAKARGVPYTRFVRETLERAVAAASPRSEGVADQATSPTKIPRPSVPT